MRADWALPLVTSADAFGEAWMAAYTAIHGAGTSRGHAAQVMTPSAGVSRSTS